MISLVRNRIRIRIVVFKMRTLVQQLGCGDFAYMYVFHLTSCPHLSIVTASTDLGMRKGKGTAALGSRHVEWKTEAGYPLSECQEDPVPPQRVGGLWYSESPLIKRGKKYHLFLSCLPSPFQIHPFFTLVKCHQLRI